MLKYFSTHRLKFRLPALTLTLASLSVITIAISSYYAAYQNAEKTSSEHLNSVALSRKAQLEFYLESIRSDIQLMAHNEVIHDAMRGFADGWAALEQQGIDVPNYLKLKYSHASKSDKEVRANELRSGQSPYVVAHNRYNSWFVNLDKYRGYYDVFLFDAKGTMNYSVAKESDYATNIYTGKWQNTSLSRLIKKTLTSKDGQAFFADFEAYAPSNGTAAAFIASPVYEKGELLGAIAYQMPLDKISHILSEKSGLGNTGDTVLYGTDGLLRNDSRLTEGDDILKVKVSSKLIRASTNSDQLVHVYSPELDKNLMAAVKHLNFLGVDLHVTAFQQESEILAPVRMLRLKMIALGLGSFFVVAIAAILFTRRVTVPLSLLTNAMNSLAAGETDVEITMAERKDELGDMDRAVKTFKENAIERIKLENEKSQTDAAREKRQKHMEELVVVFEQKVGKAIENVSAGMERLDTTGIELQNSTQNANMQASEAAATSEQTSAGVQSIATATEELSMSIQEISRQVSEASKVSKEADIHATEANEKVSGLATTANNVGSIVTLIQEIAEQTNLLALNATIEAARAGDAGRGFAVVASEVKELATQTGKATEDIARQIASIQGATRETVEVITSISEAVKDVNAFTMGIASAMEQQGVATSEISNNVNEAASGTQRVSENITGLSEIAGAVNEHAETVGTVAGNVRVQTNELNAVITEFVQDAANI